MTHDPMRVASHLDHLHDYAPGEACSCREHHSHVQVQLRRTLVGLGFVVGGMALGALSIITPIVAAVFHVTGSLLAVFNSFRLLREGEELEPHSSGSTGVVSSTSAMTGSLDYRSQPAHA